MLLEVHALESFYARAQILGGLSFSAREGEVIALLGRNGAGKTTTLRSLMGLMPRTRGRAVFAGREILALATHAIARLGLGYVPEDRRCFAELTVEENLAVGRQPARPGVPAWDAARVYGLFPHLEGLRRRAAGSLSGGEQQMLTIARTLMGNPRLILMDEPSEGLAPRVVEDMARAIRALKQEGLAVVLCEQNFRFAASVSDRALILEQGRIRHEGTMAALAADDAARRQYLSV